MGEVITVGLDIATKAFFYAASIMFRRPPYRAVSMSFETDSKAAKSSRAKLSRKQERMLAIYVAQTTCNYVFAKGD